MSRRNRGAAPAAPPEASSEPTHEAAQSEAQTNGGGSPPVYSRRYPIGNGETVEVAVFARNVDNGANSFTAYNTGVKRHFKSGDEWRENKFFPPHALPVVAQALLLAFAWIAEERNGNT